MGYQFMKTRRDIFKIVAGTAAAATGSGHVSCAKASTVQPILQDILQTQTMSGPVGLSFLLRSKHGKSLDEPWSYVIDKHAVEAQYIKNFNEFDRAEFRKILKKVANKRSHEYTSLKTMSNRVAIYSRRGAANIFVIHPEDQKYVERHLKQMHIYGIKVLVHPDVPKDYALAVYKGQEVWDGAGVFCPVKEQEKTHASVYVHDVDKFMYLGRYK